MVRKEFPCDFLSFFGRPGSAKNCLKPCVLRGFCDLRSHAKVLGTSCCEKGLEGVFGRFLARLGRAKSTKNLVFYVCFGDQGSIFLKFYEVFVAPGSIFLAFYKVFGAPGSIFLVFYGVFETVGPPRNPAQIIGTQPDVVRANRNLTERVSDGLVLLYLFTYLSIYLSI